VLVGTFRAVPFAVKALVAITHTRSESDDATLGRAQCLSWQCYVGSLGCEECFELLDIRLRQGGDQDAKLGRRERYYAMPHRIWPMLFRNK